MRRDRLKKSRELKPPCIVEIPLMKEQDRILNAETSIPILQAELAKIAALPDQSTPEDDEKSLELKWAVKRLLTSINHLAKFIYIAKKRIETNVEL